MSFKTIRESYSDMLDVFGEAGMTLSESQKAKLDKTVGELEDSISRKRQRAISETRRLTEARLEKEYREVFESIMENQAKNAELAAKIQERVMKMNEAKTLAGKVSDYLELYLESVLPRKTVVDYSRMQKLERLHESLKDMLGVDEFGMEDRMQKLEESYKQKLDAKTKELEDAKAKLFESQNERVHLKCKVGRMIRESRMSNAVRAETEPVKRAEPAKAVNSAKTEPVKAVKRAEPAKVVNSAKTEPVKAVKRAETKPVEVKKPAAKIVETPIHRPTTKNRPVVEAVAPGLERRKTVECDSKKLTLEKEIDDILGDNEISQFGNLEIIHNGHDISEKEED